MPDGTRIVELRKDVDGLKATTERAEKSLEELKIMDGRGHTGWQQGGYNGGLLGANTGGQPGYQVPTKCFKVEFPKFYGEDLRGWVYRCEQFFEVDDTPPDAKVKLAALHLEGKALQWHQIFMKSRLTREIPNWEEYIRATSDRFGVLLYDDPMAELVNLKPTENYSNEVEIGTREEEVEDSKEEEPSSEDTTPKYQVSMNAMTGVHDFTTMRVSGTSQRKFTWRMQGVQFITNVMVLPLVGCDVALGIQWLVTLGDIKWNFDQLRMEFVMKGQKLSMMCVSMFSKIVEEAATLNTVVISKL
ncbi:hypothetical protein BUALT_Bualt10G0035300 [Buddleja alternifolia]|uniref:Retrotransposon gag domain-containing protein n=1 Tax=Buddleja alternifolia TaxID=168488 RepID=A0AAV6X6P7_9LAMI|nr:hypothetical protein BUALT_Bualt10G0035300 [Buddleja alternifolia]